MLKPIDDDKTIEIVYKKSNDIQFDQIEMILVAIDNLKKEAEKLSSCNEKIKLIKVMERLHNLKTLLPEAVKLYFKINVVKVNFSKKVA
jgi:prefoldin subunit 5